MSDRSGDALTLALRSGLPAEFLYLREAYPRMRWTESGLNPIARHWLGMHAGFRSQQAGMADLVARWRSGAVETRALHSALIPALQQFLQHLDAHHSIESGHYFPAMQRIEPRIEAGVALLDRDHDDIHAHIEALVETGRGFHQAMTMGAAEADDRLLRLAEALDKASPDLARHLDDEEDIVIPLIALHGDPLAD
ncbi:MAG: hemerythrin domain-containing protein [Brevundimonas sp.]|uniref:hemerythrin domain-containing protein n=1 Tax=Brevundimonas sp. TaxID=1871086 RepID=UPI00271B7DF4|nr:hemerythrin domain-containing protein [Brevundimonas sp.]MDO9587622.1 hemerythrin domain-containing protein [Brevundimonas sp.]MDP3656287.1 hemerythrin domain-containing protein [Brevundimonas sp.]MDZ4112667.1 hemerythrin domain-containing protein [Brevundimonas sp.]